MRENAPVIFYSCPSLPTGRQTLALKTIWDMLTLGPDSTANMGVEVPGAPAPASELAIDRQADAGAEDHLGHADTRPRLDSQHGCRGARRASTRQ
jgi:hypothetical protein